MKDWVPVSEDLPLLDRGKNVSVIVRVRTVGKYKCNAFYNYTDGCWYGLAGKVLKSVVAWQSLSDVPDANIGKRFTAYAAGVFESWRAECEEADLLDAQSYGLKKSKKKATLLLAQQGS